MAKGLMKVRTRPDGPVIEWPEAVAKILVKSGTWFAADEKEKVEATPKAAAQPKRRKTR